MYFESMKLSFFESFSLLGYNQLELRRCISALAWTQCLKAVSDGDLSLLHLNAVFKRHLIAS